MLAGGAYMVGKDTLLRIRTAIAREPAAIDKVLGDAAFREKYGSIKGEKNKILPKEFAEAVKKQPLIANKQFYYEARLQPETILQNDFADVLMENYRAGKGVNAYLEGIMRP